MTRVKVQTLFKAFLIISLSFFSANASASFSMECEGLITIRSDLVLLSDNNNSIKASIQVHNHTFTCTGHSKEFRNYGKSKNAEIVLPFTINKKWLKKGTNLRAKMVYRTWRGGGGGKSTKWTALKIVETIPPKKVPTKPKQSPRVEIPKSPSEGIDMFVEKTLWKKYKGKLPSYKEFTLKSVANERISVTKEYFTIFHGDLFKVIIPKSFEARPLHPIERFDVNAHRNEDLEIEAKLPPKYFEFVKINEAFFTSPDGLVEFYVYAKDSSNPPQSYMKVAEDETELSSNSSKFSHEKEYLNYLLKAWVTIKAKNNSYYRSYTYQRACHDDFSICETLVFAIKYSSVKAYNKYRDFFIAFNQSLVRTAEF